MRLSTLVDTQSDIVKWGALVKAALATQSGWSIKRLAQELGKSPQSVSQLLSGYKHGQRRPVMPSCEDIEAIDKKLGLPRQHQYQALGLDGALGLTNGNPISLGVSLSHDGGFTQALCGIRQQHEERVSREAARVRELEARVHALEQLHSIETGEPINPG